MNEVIFQDNTEVVVFEDRTTIIVFDIEIPTPPVTGFPYTLPYTLS